MATGTAPGLEPDDAEAYAAYAVPSMRGRQKNKLNPVKEKLRRTERENKIPVPQSSAFGSVRSYAD